MSERRLVRIWDRNWDLRGQHFVQWDDGTFIVALADRVGAELWERCGEMDHQITVESTSQLVWWIDRIERRGDDSLKVVCRPYIDVLRASLISDDYLTWLWLDAEKTWKANH